MNGFFSAQDHAGDCALMPMSSPPVLSWATFLETFRTQAASLRDGEGLPRFVEHEFRDFLRCGSLAGGFARFRCTACGLDRLVSLALYRRTHPAHAEGRLGYNGADRDGQNGNPGKKWFQIPIRFND